MSEAPTEAQIQQRAYDNAMVQYGMGSDVQKAAQAVTGLLQGLAGDNLAGALANASSPYLATKIKELTTDPATGEVNKASNAMAHAVLGAVVTELNNQSAVAGGLGAGGGELSAHVILNTLFPGKKVSDLSEKEKQQVSALSQLASGLAGGLTTGDMAGAVTAAQAGKNAFENNAVAFVMTPAGPVPMPIIFPGINDADANKEMALALDNALKNIGKSINDFINGEGEVNIVEVKAALSPEQQKQFDILWERNALTVNQPPVTMESLAKQAGFGQAFVRGARETKNQNGNTVYIMDNGGAGSQMMKKMVVINNSSKHQIEKMK
ncbi:VENN motif pre-toxin domain-containing protein [Proteus faecis]|uniref:VENN motif pre-toxin domain-containing protein n=1 Tax=Proteus faecis TaxID=2050967 RepID=UPI003075CD8A